ncbi:hypothetical protein B4U80_03625 [Leptotrombidium deliense]|nr:hypothetical protein B4U80_03625 [Leptotrombidium deliense]
MSLTFK